MNRWSSFLAVMILSALSLPLATGQSVPTILPDVNGFEAFVGSPFSVQFSVQNPPSGGVSQGWAITAGSLPAGLTLTATGLLSGTPTTPQSTTFQVTTVYTFPSGAAAIPPLVLSRTYQFNVDNQLRILTATPLPQATAGRPVNYVISASMPAYWSYEVTNLPQSININLPENSPTMSLTGVFPAVTVPTTYFIDLYAFGGTFIEQSANRLFQVTVNPAPSLSGLLPAATQGVPYVSALSVSGGTAPFTFSIVSGALPPGLALNAATGAIGGTPTAVGSFAFQGRVTDANNATAQASFSIIVSPAPLSVLTGTLPAGQVGVPYQASIDALGGLPPYSFSIASGALPPGVSLQANGSLQGTPALAGEFAFAVRVQDSLGASANGAFRIVVQPPPLVILTSNLPDGTAGAPYSAALAASGGVPSYTWSIASGSLPGGLTMSPSSGAISGTPAAAGEFRFTVAVTDSRNATASRSFVIRVFEPLRILTENLPAGTEGVAYSASLSAAGGSPPYAWSASGPLPPGVSLSASTGTLSGTPTTAGNFTFTATVSDQTGATTSRSLSIRIVAPLRIQTEALPSGMQGTAYSAPLSATGGFPPYAWSASGSLPPGLTLDASTGTLAGTPTQTGTFGFTVSVSDTARTTASRAFTIRVVAPLRILTSSLPQAVEERDYSAAIQAEGGAPPYSFSVASGSLPPGLTLSSDGTLSGSPSQPGEFTFTARASDSLGFRAERPLTITVLEVPRILTASLPDGRVGQAYSAGLSASGRAPFTWSLSGGSLPQGLSLNAQTGAISGTPLQHGSFPLEVAVTDGNQPALSARRSFTLRIELPPLPTLSITQLQDTAPPASQPAFGLQLSQAFPVELNGTATLSFTPDPGLPPDPTIRFASGGTTVNFTIPAGQTAAVAAAGSQFAFQTGTTAGTITLSVTLRLGATVLDPSPFVVRTLRIAPSGPVITNLAIVRTATGFEVRVTGYSNIREITGATFRFTAAPGSSLGTAEVSLPVAGAFQQWFASETSRQFGGQFLLVVPFTVDGNVGGLASLQVTLTSSAGSGSATANF